MDGFNNNKNSKEIEFRFTRGTKVVRGVKIFLLYISAQISYPPSMQRFLGLL